MDLFKEEDRGTAKSQREVVLSQFAIDELKRLNSPFRTAEAFNFDEIIDPRDTRKVLGLCLSVCREGQARQLFPNTYGVARF